jgi:hypothetical protein
MRISYASRNRYGYHKIHLAVVATQGMFVQRGTVGK